MFIGQFIKFKKKSEAPMIYYFCSSMGCDGTFEIKDKKVASINLNWDYSNQEKEDIKYLISCFIIERGCPDTGMYATG